MNRIYKVVWNEARNCYVVASELAKKQTKGCGKKMLAAVLAAGIFSVTGPGSVWADPANPLDGFHYISISSSPNPPLANFNNDGAKKRDSIAIGAEAETGGNDTVAIGYKAAIISADGSGNSSNSAVAVGMNSKVYNSVGGIAIGRQAVVGRAPGVGIEAEDFGISIGYQASSLKQGIAVGGIGTSSGEYGTSIGTWSNTENVRFGTALGYNASATVNSGVALGAQSVADVGARMGEAVSGYDPATGTPHADTSEVKAAYQDLQTKKAAYNANQTTENEKALKTANLNYRKLASTWRSTSSAVSVGNAEQGYTRQIVNVAAGTEDTDAVNVAQLKALSGQVGSSIVHYYSVKSDQQGTGTNYANDGATGADSMVIGVSSSSSGNNSTVLGNNNKLAGEKNGRNNSIVVGQSLEVNGVHNAVFATDYNNYDNKETKVAGEANTVLGVGNLVGYTAEQNGTTWTYAKTGGGRGSDQNVAVGMKNTVNGSSVVVGTSSEAENLGSSFGQANKIIGSNDNHGGGQWGVALGNKLTVSGEMAVAVGNESTAEGDWTVAIGAGSATKKGKDIAMGYKANASGGWSMALGADSVASAQTATAVGGYGAKATVNAGVALGSYSVADTAAGVSGYDPSTKAASTETGSAWKSTLGAVSVGDKTEGESRQITNVAAGTQDTDAVNVAQLKKLQETVTATAGEAGKHTTVIAGDYVTVTEGTNAASGKEYTISGPQLGSTDGTVTITDKVENGKKVGYNLSVDTSAISGTVNKGIDFAGDSGSAINKKMGETLEIKGGAAELTDNNIGVVSEGGALKVKLAKNITGVETLTVSEKITVGETTVGKDTVTTKTVEAETVKAGDTTINTEGVSIQNGPSITKNNVDMHNQQIHNVADGTDKHDAATVGQVEKLYQEAGKEINRIDNRVDRLDSRVDKVGAGAAALAALHPVDFDADDKVDVAAGWGHYKGQNAMALGAFYRPDERTMFSIGGAFGNGENLINAGVTFKLDKRPNGYHNITSKAQLVKQVAQLQADNKALLDRMKAMDEKMAKMEKMLEAK